MTKHWKATATKGDASYILYVVTHDEAIRLDREAASTGGSLISYVRHGRFPSEAGDDHRDLAFGALSHHANGKGMRLMAAPAETDSVPERLEQTWLGGRPGSNTFAVAVYEQPIT